MKTIVLIRHAKSSWKYPELKDIERPLKKRGLNDAPLMGKVLKKHHLIPDLIISSPAVRAMETAKIIADEFGYDQNLISVNPRIYLESKSGLLKVINGIEDRFNTVFMISHNPGITDVANSLINGSEDSLPTSGIIGILFDRTTWSEVENGKGKKLFLEIPKTYR